MTFDEWWAKHNYDDQNGEMVGEELAEAAWNASLANITVEQLMPEPGVFEYRAYETLRLRIEEYPYKAIYEWLRTHIETQLNKLKEGKEE